MHKAIPGPAIVSFSPFRCRMWQLHDRAEEHITEASCREEIESIARVGQLVPALGRPVRGDPACDCELIYGARRLFVARHLNAPLRVELREISDREAIVAMDIENRQRQDISPYERGLSYARWLREGHFGSQDDIANGLKISKSQVSRFLKIARLPPVVVSAFGSPTEICEAWGLELAAALEDPERRAFAIRKARDIRRSGVRLSPKEVCHRLLSAHVSVKRLPRVEQEELVLNGGKVLFRIRHERAWVSLRVPASRLSGIKLTAIRSALTELLNQEAIDSEDHNSEMSGEIGRSDGTCSATIGPEE